MTIKKGTRIDMPIWVIKSAIALNDLPIRLHITIQTFSQNLKNSDLRGS